MTRPVRWMALTGTPGVGKTTVAKALRKRGVPVLDGKKIAKKARAFVAKDRKRKSLVVDLEKVSAYLDQEPVAVAPVVIDAHWSHELRVAEAAIVLRLRPRVLRARLAKRKYPVAKILENLEAEGMGLILAEAAKRLPQTRVAELDTTDLTVDETVRRLVPFLEKPDSRLTNLEIGRVDWTPDFLEWSLTGTVGSSTRS